MPNKFNLIKKKDKVLNIGQEIDIVNFCAFLLKLGIKKFMSRFVEEKKHLKFFEIDKFHIAKKFFLNAP